MEMSRGLLVLAVVLVAGVVAQFDDRDLDVDLDSEQPRFRPNFDTVASCRGKEADIFFILDSSSSIYIEDYELQRQFVREVVSRLDIAPQYTRIAALTYSDNYRLSFGFSDFQSRQELRNAINDRNIPYLTGLTNTADAIRFVRTNGQFRPEVTRVIVVITDGYSREPASTSNEAELARREGFYMFVIGVGQYTDEREWRSIANDPDNNYMYNITNYRALNRLYDIIPNRICVLPPIIISSGSCLIREDADLIFVAGPSEARTAFGTVSNIVNALRDDTGRLRLSLLLNDCKANQFPLSEPSVFCEEYGDSIPRQDSYLNLLKQMREEARNARGLRPQSNQVAVLFIDQQSMSLNNFGILREARDAHFDGIEIYVVDLGVRPNQQQILSRIASDPNNLFSTLTARNIGSRLLNAACDSLNERSGGGFIPRPTPAK